MSLFWSIHASNAQELPFAHPLHSLSPEQTELYWQFRQTMDRQALSLVNAPLPAARAQARAILHSLQTTHSPWEALALAQNLLYAPKGAFTGVSEELLEMALTPNSTHPWTRWLAALAWVSHGGKSPSIAQKRTLTTVINTGARQLGRIARSVKELHEWEASQALPLDAAWILDQNWLSWMRNTVTPAWLDYRGHQAWLEAEALADRIHSYRVWTNLLAQEWGQSKSSDCPRLLMTEPPRIRLDLLPHPLKRR